MLGHLLHYWYDPLGFLVRCAREYGDVVKLHIGKPTLLLTNPDDIRHVLVTHADRYAKTLRISGALGRRALGESVLTSLGEEHRKRRRALQPSFHSRAIEVFGTVVTDAVDRWRTDRQDGERLNIADHMRLLARRIMTHVLFGSDIERDDSTLLDAISTRRRYHEHIVGAVLPAQYQPARVLFGYRKAIRHIDVALSRALHMRRESTEHADDMLSQWIRTRYDDGTSMTDAEIRAEALTFMDTGFETIGIALTWTWYLLAEHPDVEARLASELRDILGDRLPCAGDLPRLRYTAAVFKESLRLYPPAWNFVRTALASDMLPCGVQVQRGTKLFLCQYIVHRNPTYFSQPEAFNPDRFEEQADSERRRFRYFPFGGGPHVCLGEPLAELECVLVLATLASRLKFELEPDQTVRPDVGFALRPHNGIRVRVMRKPAPGA